MTAKANAKVSGGYKNFNWGRSMTKRHSSKNKSTVSKSTTVKKINFDFHWELRIVPFALIATWLVLLGANIWLALLITFVANVLFNVHPKGRMH